MGQRCVLGVDIGTSSSKGVLVAEDGTIVASATREHRVERPQPGRVEMDAEIWWDEFRSLSAELVGDAEIIAVGVSGMGPCVLLTDEADRPVRPVILYGVDTRAGAQLERLERELGAARIAEVGGSRLSAQAAGPKMAWVAEEEPEAYARARRLFMPASWLARRLTGAYVLDRHSASQCTPLFDIESGEWHEPWAPLVAPGIELPTLAWPGDLAGTITAEAAAATGLAEGTPVIVGTIDAWSEALSIGAVGPGDLMLMYGTTMFLVATVPDILRTPSMWTTVGAFPGTNCLAGGMATSGAITGWIRELTGAGYPDLLAEAAASGPGARGLLMLPYFAGERTPLLDPDARGMVAGLTLSHGRGDLYRAALEATAFGVRHNIETMREAGAQIDRIAAVGGGTQGSLWTQIVSDVTGLEQQLTRTSVGASYGAAFLAACAVADTAGTAPDIADWNPVVATVRPDPATAAAYDRGYRLYRELYTSTVDLAHELARVEHEAAA